MNTETLTCESCSSEWERERKRGRKPRLCPECSESGSKATLKRKPPRTEAEFAVQQGRPDNVEDREWRFDPMRSPTIPNFPVEEQEAPPETYYVIDPVTGIRLGPVAMGAVEPDPDATLVADNLAGKKWDSCYLGDTLIKSGSEVKVDGIRGLFKFKAYCVSRGGRPYIDLWGIKGSYAAKSYAVEPARIRSAR